MNRTDLFALLKDIRTEFNLNQLIIAGSQAVHAVTSASNLPQSALRSIEVDIVLIGEQFHLKSHVFQKFGMGSNYLAEHGVVADPIGKGLLALPPDWESRLVEVIDQEGEYSHHAIEIHDIASAKLSAGRQKDYEFLIELIMRNIINPHLLKERFELLRETAFGGAVDDRKQSLGEKLAESDLKSEAAIFLDC